MSFTADAVSDARIPSACLWPYVCFMCLFVCLFVCLFTRSEVKKTETKTSWADLNCSRSESIIVSKLFHVGY